jgi:hypothetical protein
VCERTDASIFRDDDERLLLVAHHGVGIPFGPPGEFSLPLIPGTANGRSVLEADGARHRPASGGREFPEGSETARRWVIDDAQRSP